MACPGIFDPGVFRDNGSSNLDLRSSDEASDVYRRTDCSREFDTWRVILGGFVAIVLRNQALRKAARNCLYWQT